MNSRPQNRSLDLTPLDAKFTLGQAIAQFKKQSHGPIVLIIYGLIVSAVGSYASVRLIAGRPILPFLLAALMLLAIGYIYLRSWFDNQKMRSFASVNSFSFLKNDHLKSLDGMIFNIGHSRQATGYLSSAGRSFDVIANYSYTTGYGKNRQTYRYGFVRIELPRNLPHMVLDSRGNDFFGMSSLAMSFRSTQKLRLEGDFNEHFTLYAPKEYERDALYVFTPDIMQLLIDSVSDFDVEIVGNSLYLYSKRPLKLADRQSVESLLAVTERLGAKIGRRVDYYADERIEDRSIDQIADHGRRLKSGVPVLIVVIVITYIVVQAILYGL